MQKCLQVSNFNQLNDIVSIGHFHTLCKTSLKLAWECLRDLKCNCYYNETVLFVHLVFQVTNYFLLKLEGHTKAFSNEIVNIIDVQRSGVINSSEFVFSKTYWFFKYLHKAWTLLGLLRNHKTSYKHLSYTIVSKPIQFSYAKDYKKNPLNCICLNSKKFYVACIIKNWPLDKGDRCVSGSSTVQQLWLPVCFVWAEV